MSACTELVDPDRSTYVIAEPFIWTFAFEIVVIAEIAVLLTLLFQAFIDGRWHTWKSVVNSIVFGILKNETDRLWLRR